MSMLKASMISLRYNWPPIYPQPILTAWNIHEPHGAEKRFRIRVHGVCLNMRYLLMIIRIYNYMNFIRVFLPYISGPSSSQTRYP